MASPTIRPTPASSSFRLCDTTSTCAASLVSLNSSSRRFPYLARGNDTLLFFPSVSYYPLNLLYNLFWWLVINHYISGDSLVAVILKARAFFVVVDM